MERLNNTRPVSLALMWQLLSSSNMMAAQTRTCTELQNLAWQTHLCVLTMYTKTEISHSSGIPCFHWFHSANIILTETAAFGSRMENIISKRMADYLTYHSRISNCENIQIRYCLLVHTEYFKNWSCKGNSSIVVLLLYFEYMG